METEDGQRLDPPPQRHRASRAHIQLPVSFQGARGRGKYADMVLEATSAAAPPKSTATPTTIACATEPTSATAISKSFAASPECSWRTRGRGPSTTADA